MPDDQRAIQRKLRVLQHADKIGCFIKTCRYFGIARSSFYRWQSAYRSRGEQGLRAFKIYDRHTQALAINFVDDVIEKFPFRIREIRTDNGLGFQAKFHWHDEDKCIRSAYIKPSSPQLNGKVERSHLSDQLPSNRDDVDLEAKLEEWQRFYNLARPQGAHKGKTPYEALREKL